MGRMDGLANGGSQDRTGVRCIELVDEARTLYIQALVEVFRM